MKKILIVEDEQDLIEIIDEKFTREGFTVLKAGDGVEGLKVSLKEHPDLILLDIVMPRMDGLTMLKKLRQDSWGKTAEVILLTNLSPTEKSPTDTEYLIKSDWKLQDIVDKVKKKLKIV